MLQEPNAAAVARIIVSEFDRIGENAIQVGPRRSAATISRESA
jgi:hypothetical protein